MNIPGTQWTSGEAAAVNEFLNSAVGRKWLGVLHFRKPEIDRSSMEAAALSGAFAAGYDRLLFGEIPATRASLPPETPGLKAIDPTKD